jgi:sec-independent protein translocase protein TatC
MSFTGVFGLVVLAIVALALLGPSKLPAGMEQMWLVLTNFRRSGSENPPLTLDQARRSWEVSGNPFYDLIQIMYGAVEHLVELRRRIFIVIGALVVGAVVAAVFINRILAFLTEPAGGAQLIVLRPTDMVWTYMEVIFAAAVVVAMPVLLYQALMFVRPALENPRELSVFRAVAFIAIPLVAVFFLLGMAFAYFIMLPMGLKYLQSMGSSFASVAWNIREYFSFVLAVMLWIGAAFLTPLVMALLARLGMVSPGTLAKQWRYAIVGIAFAAAAITPTVDPVNMGLVMAPLLGLYVLGVVMARAVYRPRAVALDAGNEELVTADGKLEDGQQVD